MAYTRKMAGKVPVLKQDLVFEETPTPGSENAVTSGGVAEAVGNVSKQTEQDMKDMEEMFLVNLPCDANTLRFEFSKMDYDPTVAGVGSSGTWKKLNAKFHNVWDWTRNNTYWGTAFKNAFTSSDNFVSVIGCGTLSTPIAMYQMFMGCTTLKYVCYLPTTNVTNFENAFGGCSSLEIIEYFDTTAAVTIQSCFYGCSSLKKLPLISSASSMTSVSSAFNGCVSVESGALDNYNTLSVVEGITSHTDTFKNCGKDTTTGAAELAQIPSDWGGTAPATLNMGAPQNLTEPLSPSVIDGDDSLTK